MTRFFVTGTDTAVGKTRISEALITLFRQQGKQVAAMKPVASGCELTPQGLRNDDAVALMQQANVDLPYDMVNPYAFEPAIAPHIASKEADIEIDLEVIKHNFKQIQQQAEVVIVEGAGGWLVPLNDQQSMADLAITLGLPIILVVAIRLGCMNHALLTVQAIEQSGLPLYGWIANHMEHNTESAEIVNRLRQSIAAPCLGNVPILASDQFATDHLNMSKHHG